jgi:hypothetical protein
VKRLLAVIVVVASACNRAPPEPAPDPARDAGRAPAKPDVHTIVEADHLKNLAVAVGDVVAAPKDEAFEWRLSEQGPGLFTADGPLRMRASRSGETRLVTRGEPVCRKQDGGCGTSTLEWTHFVRVR